MKNKGFILIELIVSLAIMGTLAAIVAPVYTKYTVEGKMAKTEANMANIKQAFINYFYHNIMEQRRPEFPPAPADSIMDDSWANSPVLNNGKTPSSLFSEGIVPKNGFDQPFIYYLLEPTTTEKYGFVLRDPKTGKTISFRP